jgi:hypothetical protein
MAMRIQPSHIWIFFLSRFTPFLHHINRAPNFLGPADIVEVNFMRVISRSTVAVVVTLTTLIICFFGIRAELNQAKQSASARTHATTPKADAAPPLAREEQPEKR